MITTRRFLSTLFASIASLFVWRRSAPAAIEVPIPAKSRKELIRGFLEQESPRAAAQIAKEIRESSPWFRLIPQKEWLYLDDSSAPVNATPQPFADLGGIPLGFTTRSYNLEELSIASPPLCLEGLYSEASPDKKINERIEILRECVKAALIERKRSAFDRLCEVREGTPEQPADPCLIAQMLATIERNGAAKAGVVTIVGGEDELSKLAYSVPMEVDDHPVRFKNGIRVKEFLDAEVVAGWIGDRVSRPMRMNPDYETADAEAIYLVHPEVYHQLNPNPTLTFGNFKYDAGNYVGESKWEMIPSSDGKGNLVINPKTGTPYYDAGRFVMTISTASKPIHTQYGGVIIVRRPS